MINPGITILALVIFGMTVSQYPYQMYERLDNSIVIYRIDQWGNKIPLVDFINLEQLVRTVGIWW